MPLQLENCKQGVSRKRNLPRTCFVLFLKGQIVPLPLVQVPTIEAMQQKKRILKPRGTYIQVSLRSWRALPVASLLHISVLHQFAFLHIPCYFTCSKSSNGQVVNTLSRVTSVAPLSRKFSLRVIASSSKMKTNIMFVPHFSILAVAAPLHLALIGNFPSPSALYHPVLLCLFFALWNLLSPC